MSSQLDESRSQLQFIADARKLLKPSEVRIGHVPNWLRLQILNTIGPNSWRCNSGESLLRDAERKAGGWDTFLDHWGSTKLFDEIVFVSEPYLNQRMFAHAQRFADLLKINLTICPNSWWYPGHTTRLIFSLKKPNEGYIEP